MLGLRQENKEATGPLSLTQERLWFLYKLHPQSPIYNLSIQIRIIGNLNIANLKSALMQVTEHNPMLRTTFVERSGEPVQVISENPPMIDFRIVDQPTSDESNQYALLEEAKSPFDIQKSPPWRVVVYKRENDNYIVQITMHHIITDMWSMVLFQQEVAACYRALEDGSLPMLPKQKQSYLEYSVDQRKKYEAGDLDSHIEFWRSTLHGASFVLDLPTDKKRPEKLTFSGARYRFSLPKEVFNSVKNVASVHRTTPFVVLFSAFNVLLSHLSGERDFLVGFPVAGRRSINEPVFGFFVNTLVVRSDLTMNPNFSELISANRNNINLAYEHQWIPFDKIVQDLKPKRDGSRQPLFQVLTRFRREGKSFSWGDNLTVFTAEHVGLPVSKFDFTVGWVEQSDGLYGIIEYSTEIFDQGTIQNHAKRLILILEKLLAAVNIPVMDIDVLLPNEEREIAVREQASICKSPQTSIPDWFKDTAQKFHSKTAVVYNDVKMTYKELDKLSDVLALTLYEMGITVEDIVVLLLPVTPYQIISILAILKLGAVYCPISTELPADRIKSICVDASPAMIVTTADYESLVEGLCPVFYLDLHKNYRDTLQEVDIEEKIFKVKDFDRVACNNAAYIIYTSGSTGKPKGVVIEHRNVVRLFEQIAIGIQPTSSDVWTMYHSYSFDFSVWEIWGALFFGGKLVIVPPKTARAPRAFLDLLCSERITMLSLTPSAFWLLDEVARRRSDISELQQLKYIFFGGEKLDFAKLRPWVLHYGVKKPKLINMYGITEITVHATYKEISEDDITKGTRSLIGRPIADLTIRILNSALNRVPDGVVGEIYIEGPGVARKYHREVELTRQRFLASPYTDIATRMYKTGDLARWNKEGELEFIGRSDSQIKIRGYRIELGEIEYGLSLHDGVIKTAAIIRSNVDDHPKLLAYATVTPGSKLDGSILRDFLKKHLPEYMIPNAVIIIPDIPLTSNGKLAIDKLPTFYDNKQERILARNELERMLVDIFRKTLDIEEVGINEDFFDLGGHSLLATKLVMRIEDVFGVSMPLGILFKHRSISNIIANFDFRGAGSSAQDINKSNYALYGSNDASNIEILNESRSEQTLFVLHPIGGNVNRYCFLADQLGDSVRVVGISALAGATGNVSKMPETVEEICQQYMADIIKIQREGPYYILGWSSGGILAYELACQLKASGHEVGLLALLDTGDFRRQEKRYKFSAMASIGHMADDDDILDWWVFLSTTVSRLVGRLSLLDPIAKFWTCNESERRSALVSEIERYKKKCSPFKAEDYLFLFDIFRAQRRAFRVYTPPKYSGDLLLFLATYSPDHAKTNDYWNEACGHEISCYEIACRHLEIVEMPYVKKVADIIYNTIFL